MPVSVTSSTRDAPSVERRGPTAAILIFIVFNAIFWLAFEQAGSSKIYRPAARYVGPRAPEPVPG